MGSDKGTTRYRQLQKGEFHSVRIEKKRRNGATCRVVYTSPRPKNEKFPKKMNYGFFKIEQRNRPSIVEYMEQKLPKVSQFVCKVERK